MSCYLALLRGVNVSGKNALRMEELKASLTALGLSVPATTRNWRTVLALHALCNGG